MILCTPVGDIRTKMNREESSIRNYKKKEQILYTVCPYHEKKLRRNHQSSYIDKEPEGKRPRKRWIRRNRIGS